eukprot:7565971-Pyramimonas_sp.AAC.2
MKFVSCLGCTVHSLQDDTHPIALLHVTDVSEMNSEDRPPFNTRNYFCSAECETMYNESTNQTFVSPPASPISRLPYEPWRVEPFEVEVDYKGVEVEEAEVESARRQLLYSNLKRKVRD